MRNFDNTHGPARVHTSVLGSSWVSGIPRASGKIALHDAAMLFIDLHLLDDICR